MAIATDDVQMIDEQAEIAEAETQPERETQPPAEPAAVPFTSDLRDALRAADAAIATCDDEIERLKEELKEAKARREQAVMRMRQLAREDMPLFEATQPAMLDTSQPQQAETGDDSWREVPLSDALGGAIGSKAYAALADAKIITVGDLSDWTAAHPLTDVKGIGQATADKIDAAMVTFWEDRNNETATGAQDSQAD